MTSHQDPNAADVPLRRLSPRASDHATEPSPARDALMSNLRVADADAQPPGLALKKRKSWFGSVREAFHKGALSAKAAVDGMRGEQQQGGRKPMIATTTRSPFRRSISMSPPQASAGNKDDYHHGITTPEPRGGSLDSAASTTPLKSHASSPQLERSRTFSPRQAVSSLRQHLHSRHGSRGHRGSVYTIIGRTSMDGGAEIAGPEQFVASPKSERDAKIEGRGRKSSVASSLVGSIRGLAHRRSMRATMPPTTVATRMSMEQQPSDQPVDPAEAGEVPLPSSPINIPSAAPVLGLDLDCSGMNMSFLRPADHTNTTTTTTVDDIRETRKLQDPANFALDASGERHRQSSLPHVPDEVKMQYTHPAVRRQQKPSMLLQLPQASSEKVTPTMPPGPTTPMPGTNVAFELDGAASDGASSAASDGRKSRVFERSVTPTTERDRKELRSMCSLDAVADAYKSAERKDSLTPCETVEEEEMSGAAGSPESNPFSPRMRMPSASTVSECPEDMPELGRQPSGDSKLYSFKLPAPAMEVCPSTTPVPVPDDDNPFDDRHVVSHGPPSPLRATRLPLRFKLKGPSDESGASMEAQVSPTSVTSVDGEIWLPEAQYTFQTPPKWGGLEAERESEDATQQRLQRNFAVPQNLASIEQRPTSTLSSAEHTEVLSDDTIARAQSLWDDVVSPGYDDYPSDSDSDEDGGMSPHGGPLVQPALWPGESSGSPEGKSTWKAGLGSDGFRFSIDTWRSGSSPSQPLPDPQPQLTPNRRAMEMSIDSVSVDDEQFDTPRGSRASAKSQRTPSMGSKLELDARRSERNMRYNAILDERAAQLEVQEKKSSSPVRMQARFFFGGSSMDEEGIAMDPHEARHFPGYLAAGARVSPRRGSPGEGHARVSSEDSMTMSLRSASDNMERLRALLGEIESDEEGSGMKSAEGKAEVMDAFTTASSPHKKRPMGKKGKEKGRGLRSDSPSPEKRPLPSTPRPTPVVGAVDSSPSTGTPRGHNKFMVLDLEIDVVSSPGSDDTEIADLPISIGVGGPHEHAHRSKENRVASGDTLDRTLDMLSSPDSGYQADDSSDHQESSPEDKAKQAPRGRSRSGAIKERRALGALSGNIV